MILAIVEVGKNSKTVTEKPLKDLHKRGLLVQLFSYYYFGFYFLKQHPPQKLQVIHQGLLFLKNQIQHQQHPGPHRRERFGP